MQMLLSRAHTNTRTHSLIHTQVVPPVSKKLACNEVGNGALAEVFCKHTNTHTHSLFLSLSGSLSLSHTHTHTQTHTHTRVRARTHTLTHSHTHTLRARERDSKLRQIEEMIARESQEVSEALRESKGEWGERVSE